MNLKTSTGSILFDHMDAESLNMKTSTGSIKGSLLTGKKFDVKSKHKDDVPSDTEGAGLCVAETSTGSIKITIVND